MSCKPSSTTSTAPKREEVFDPSAPLVGSDLLEYENLAARLLDEPVSCFRNDYIQELRAKRIPEAEIEAWARRYDGGDPAPSWHLIENDVQERVARQIRAGNLRLLLRDQAPGPALSL